MQRDFIQEFFDYCDKHEYSCEQIGFLQDNDEEWYTATKKLSECLAIRLSLILKSDQTYQIYLENFIKKEETQHWQAHINSLEFKPTLKISLESALEKWNHQLAIK